MKKKYILYYINGGTHEIINTLCQWGTQELKRFKKTLLKNKNERNEENKKKNKIKKYQKVKKKLKITKVYYIISMGVHTIDDRKNKKTKIEKKIRNKQF